ncbi:sulfite dehydrogenase, partial [Methylobacterium sp. J-067]|nr:sulfite dehydrogenase [Methylobacterium sp. J-067]
DLIPAGTPRQCTFAMEAKSIITRPSGTKRIAPCFPETTGIAWPGRSRIRGAQITTDRGKTWQDAALQEPVRNRVPTRLCLLWTW